MPNRNYVAGRRWEYDVMKELREQGHTCVRASGSHGEYDIIAYRTETKPNFVQCKLVSDEATGKRMIREWGKRKSEEHFHQTLAVKIKGIGTLWGTI